MGDRESIVVNSMCYTGRTECSERLSNRGSKNHSRHLKAAGASITLKPIIHRMTNDMDFDDTTKDRQVKPIVRDSRSDIHGWFVATESIRCASLKMPAC